MRRGHEPPPKGHYKKVIDWVDANQPESPQRLYYEIHPAETLRLLDPKRVEEPLYWQYRKDTFSRKPSFVAVLPEGRFYSGRSDAVISPDNKLIWDASQLFFRKPEQHPVFSQNQLPSASRTQETAAVLTFCASHNYYHWMFDVLPKFYLLRESGVPIDKFILNRYTGGFFHQETLRLIQIPPSKIIRPGRGFHLQARQLAVPSPAQSLPSSWACSFLRREILFQTLTKRKKGYERLYISRSDASYRKVKNDHQVTALLAYFGFKHVVLKGMAVAEQARLFYSADVIVSAHGAGLTNLVFCRPGTKVVEIFAAKYVNLCYWLLSNYVELDYHYLFGAGERLPERMDFSHVKDDIHVDLAALLRMVKLLGL
jgi:hypothetical protein